MKKIKVVCPHCGSEKVYLALDIMGSRPVNGNISDVNVDLLNAVSSDLHFVCADCESSSNGAFHEEWQDILNGSISTPSKNNDLYIRSVEEFISTLKAMHNDMTKDQPKKINLSTEKYRCPGCNSEFVYKDVNLQVMLDINNNYALVSSPMEQDVRLNCANCNSMSASQESKHHCINEILWYRLSDRLLTKEKHPVPMDEFIRTAENYVFTLKHAAELDKQGLFQGILYSNDQLLTFTDNRTKELILEEMALLFDRVKSKTVSNIEYKCKVWINGKCITIESRNNPESEINHHD